MVFTGPEVHGWHEAPDWGDVACAGHGFAWCRATAGMGTVDPRFEANWSAIPDSDLIRGAIHTLTTATVGRGQARHFVDVVGRFRGSLAAVAVQPDGHRLDDRVPHPAQVASFAEEFAELTGGHPLLIRTSWRSWARQDPHGRGREISPYLWHADGFNAYRAGGRWPAYGGWTTPTMWGAFQTACPGIAGLCTMTAFTGTADELARLVGLESNHGLDELSWVARVIGWRQRWRRRRRSS